MFTLLLLKDLQMKDRLNPGTWTVTLSTSKTATDNGLNIELTDDSKTVDAESAPFGPRYNIVSGSAGSVHTAYTTKTYGFFYPDAGLMVLSANCSFIKFTYGCWICNKW